MLHDAPVRGAVFSEDENRILSSSKDNTVHLWDAATGKRIGPSHLGLRGILSKDEKHVPSWRDNMVLEFWDVVTGECRSAPF